MKLTRDRSNALLKAHRHGALGTRHPQRGVDLVPVVYAVLEGALLEGALLADGAQGDLVGIPVDRVKPKTSTRLQRETNLRADPRAALLVEHWDPVDWDRLWWVRAHLRWEPAPPPGSEAALAARLTEQHSAYRAQHRAHRDQPFARVLVLRVLAVTGWSAEAP